MSQQIRILIVEQQREFARVLESGLRLLDQDFVVSIVPSGEEALLEFQTKFDLIVADYFLPGMSGPEVIKKARFRMPEVKAIITSEQDISVVHKHAEEIDAQKVLIKPIQQHDLMLAVKKALGISGGTGALMSAAGGDSADNVGQSKEVAKQLPQVDEIAVSALVSPLLAEVEAQAVLFVNRHGEVLLKTGMVAETLKFGELVILLAENFTRTTTIANYIGDEFAPAVHYYDGNSHDIYALSAGEDFFVVLIFPGEGKSQMGAVMAWGRPKVIELAELIEQGKIVREVVEPPKPVPVEVPEADTLPAPPPPVDGSLVADPLPLESRPTERAVPKDEPKSVDKEEALEEVIADLDDIFGLDDLKFQTVMIPKHDFSELDEASIEEVDIENVDDFWEEAANDVGKVNRESLSLEEALEMGFFDDDE